MKNFVLLGILLFLVIGCAGTRKIGSKAPKTPDKYTVTFQVVSEKVANEKAVIAKKVFLIDENGCLFSKEPEKTKTYRVNNEDMTYTLGFTAQGRCSFQDTVAVLSAEKIQYLELTETVLEYPELKTKVILPVEDKCTWQGTCRIAYDQEIQLAKSFASNTKRGIMQEKTMTVKISRIRNSE
jgi:hypothetical protein